MAAVSPGVSGRSMRSLGQGRVYQQYAVASTPKGVDRGSGSTSADLDNDGSGVTDDWTPIGSPRRVYPSTSGGGSGSRSGVTAAGKFFSATEANACENRSADGSRIVDARADDARGSVPARGGGGSSGDTQFGSNAASSAASARNDRVRGWKGDGNGDLLDLYGSNNGSSSSSSSSSIGNNNNITGVGGRGGWASDDPGMVISSAGHGQNAGGSDTGAGGRTALDAIVTSFLRNQHERCPDPVCVLPPLSLSEPHECPPRTPTGAFGAGAPPNVMKRALAWQVCFVLFVCVRTRVSFLVS